MPSQAPRGETGYFYSKSEASSTFRSLDCVQKTAAVEKGSKTVGRAQKYERHK